MCKTVISIAQSELVDISSEVADKVTGVISFYTMVVAREG